MVVPLSYRQLTSNITISVNVHKYILCMAIYETLTVTGIIQRWL